MLVYGVGSAGHARGRQAIESTLAAVEERLAPLIATPRTVLTFDERALGLRGLFPPAVADRLANIAAAYDPDGAVRREPGGRLGSCLYAGRARTTVNSDAMKTAA